MNQSSKNHNLPWFFACLGALLLSLIPSVGVVSLVVCILIIARSKFPQLIQQPFNWGLALLSLYLIGISCVAFYPGESFLGLPNLIPFFILLATFRTLINQPSQLHRLAWLLVSPCLIIVILGLGQLFANWGTPPLIHQSLGWQLVPQGQPPGRMSSVFMYANTLAAYLVAIFFLNLGLCLKYWLFNRKKLYPLLFLSVSLVANGVGVILTNSRNAWVIAFFGCLAFALYLGWRLLVFGVISAAATVLWAAFGPDPARGLLRNVIPAYFWARVSDEMYPDRPVATLRTTQWHFAWEMSLKRPLTGWGLRNFTPLYQAQTQEFLGHPHNLFLMLSAETGFIATIFLCALVGWVLAEALILLQSWAFSKSDRLIFFSYLIAFTSCIIFNLFDITILDLRTNTLGWLLLSAIAGIVFANKSSTMVISTGD